MKFDKMLIEKEIIIIIEIKKIKIEKITLNDLSNKLLIDFLEWLEVEKSCSISTRNQRLAAIHSFPLRAVRQ